jgi:hypothetical protein
MHQSQTLASLSLLLPAALAVPTWGRHGGGNGNNFPPSGIHFSFKNQGGDNSCPNDRWAKDTLWKLDASYDKSLGKVNSGIYHGMWADGYCVFKTTYTNGADKFKYSYEAASCASTFHGPLDGDSNPSITTNIRAVEGSVPTSTDTTSTDTASTGTSSVFTDPLLATNVVNAANAAVGNSGDNDSLTGTETGTTGPTTGTTTGTTTTTPPTGAQTGAAGSTLRRRQAEAAENIIALQPKLFSPCYVYPKEYTENEWQDAVSCQLITQLSDSNTNKMD